LSKSVGFHKEEVTMILSRLRIVLCSAFLATSVIASAPVAVAASGTSLRGDLSSISGPEAFGGKGVTWFMSPAQIPLIQPTYFVLRGKALSGGFSYSFSIDSVPQSAATVVEVAVRADGQQLLALGAPSALLTKQLSQDPDASSTGVPAGASPSLTASPMASASRGGGFYTMWQDIAGLNLNEVTDVIGWTYDGTHVTSFTGGSSWNWASWNGWHPVGTPYVGAYYNANHTWATVYTNAHFETSSWFPCGTSDTYYYANNVYGGPNGELGGGVNTWASSQCLYLLHYIAGTLG
jgi:hypothetical protein